MKFTPAGDIVFTVGEHPWLPGPTKGHRFRRFSAKVSGSLCGNAKHYLPTIEEICERHFGCPSRIRHRSEYGYEGEPKAFYTWDQVYEEQGVWSFKDMYSGTTVVNCRLNFQCTIPFVFLALSYRSKVVLRI